ncbi:amino acid adenylation domain-containing protein [Micromonospora sp. RP3T]|uniref:amino acid adenylation domain-containing protein n=1 Tax=Micromonospora sp. RP3T TaxID=2135446 RepID=UPI003D713470
MTTVPNPTLSAEDKRALLVRLLRERAGRAAHPPATPTQRTLWLADQLVPGSPVFNIYFALRLEGPLDLAALRAAVTEVVGRHDALRTTFAMLGDELVQRVAPPAEVPMPLTDLSGAGDAEAREAALARAMRAESDVPADLNHGPIFRASVLRLAEQVHVFQVTVHHTVFDAWSRAVFFRELVAAYAAHRAGVPSNLPPDPPQYAAVTAADDDAEPRARLHDQIEYWRAQLAGLADPDVPSSRRRSAEPSWRGSRYVFALPTRLAERMTEIARAQRATPFIAFLTVYFAFLHRYTGATDLAVLTPVAGRTTTESEDTVGLFAHTLVIRADVDGGQRFVDLLAQVRATALAAYSHQDVPYERVVEELRPPRSPGRQPFTQFMFSMHNTPEPDIDFAGLRARWLDIDVGTTKLDLQLSIGTDADDRPAAVWAYRDELLDTDDVVRFTRHLLTLLDAVVADPTTRIGDLPLLDPAEAAETLARGRGPHLAVPAEPVPARIAAQHATRRDELAVVDDRRRLDHAALDRAVRRVGHALRRRGVGRGDLVAVRMRRGVPVVAVLLAVGRVGAAPIPLEADLPEERVRLILADAGAALLVTDPDSALPAVEALVLPDSAVLDGPDPGPLQVVPLTDHDRAYVIYTSGSTGTPKGVAVGHGALRHHVAATADLWDFAPGHRYAAVQPFSVDSSVTFLYGGLATGGTLLVLDKDTALDGPELASRFAADRPEQFKLAPSHLAALTSGDTSDAPVPARVLILGGEAFSPQWARGLAAAHRDVAVYNNYGPTETTVGVLVHRVDPDDPLAHRSVVPLSTVLANCVVHVLDDALRPVPPLAPGQIYIGGPQVSLGYVRAPAATADRFLPDPYGPPGARLYRTGDRARRMPDGSVDFLGRVDHQVRIRGNRVELHEVAAVLGDHPAVREAVVHATGAGGDTTLTGYVVLAEPVGRADLIAHAAARLPTHMVPAAVVVLDALPRTAQGKLDRRRLPAPAGDDVTVAVFEEPAGETERALAGIWRDLLGRDRVSRRDDFFALGGHSLLATRLVNRISDTLGLRVSLRDVFTHSTLAGLAGMVDSTAAAGRARTATRSIITFGRAGVADLVLLPAVAGTAGCYTDLARVMRARGDTRLAALVAPGIDDDGPPMRSVGRLARHYLDVLGAAGHTGPLLLTGWSMGGLVAHEMAAVARPGDPLVRGVVLIDSGVRPARSAGPAPGEISAMFASDVVASLGLDVPTPTVEEFAWIDPAEHDAVLHRFLLDAGALPAGFELADLVRRRAVFADHVTAIVTYTPSRHRRPTLLVQADHSGDKAPGWAPYLPPDHERVVLPGTHYSLLRPPTVDRLADLLHARIVGRDDPEE